MGLPLDEALNPQWRSKSPHTSKKEQSSAPFSCSKNFACSPTRFALLFVSLGEQEGRRT